MSEAEESLREKYHGEYPEIGVGRGAVIGMGEQERAESEAEGFASMCKGWRLRQRVRVLWEGGWEGSHGVGGMRHEEPLKVVRKGGHG